MRHINGNDGKALHRPLEFVLWRAIREAMIKSGVQIGGKGAYKSAKMCAKA